MPRRKVDQKTLIKEKKVSNLCYMRGYKVKQIENARKWIAEKNAEIKEIDDLIDVLQGKDNKENLKKFV